MVTNGRDCDDTDQDGDGYSPSSARCLPELCWLLLSSTAWSLNFSSFARLERWPDLEQRWLVEVSSFGVRSRAKVTRVVDKAGSFLYQSVRPLLLVAGFLWS